MIAAHCPACGVRQLYSYGRLVALHNTPRGILLTIDCYCGTRFSELTGAGARQQLAAVGAA